MVGLLIIAHLIGDFLLQNDFIAKHKAQKTWVCLLHVGLYGLPLSGLLALGVVPLWLVYAAMLQHFLQDRFQLHMHWMKWYKQTPPDKWPIGPLFMDQSFHLAFIGVFALIAMA